MQLYYLAKTQINFFFKKSAETAVENAVSAGQFKMKTLSFLGVRCISTSESLLATM